MLLLLLLLLLLLSLVLLLLFLLLLMLWMLLLLLHQIMSVRIVFWCLCDDSKLELRGGAPGPPSSW